MQVKFGLKNCILGIVLAGAALPSMVMAKSFGSLEALSQDQFRLLSKNLGAAMHYKGVGPAEPLGLIGFDVGLEVSSTEIDEALFDLASEGDFEAPELIVPRIHANKGLPFGFDIGASLSRVPDTDISLLGAEVRYALLEGSTVTPALGIRASHARLEGLDDLALNATALEISVSKGFVMLTPYAGAGIVRTVSDPGGNTNLKSETLEQKKVYVGLTINLGIALTLEADRTDDYRTYSAKVGIRF